MLTLSRLVLLFALSGTASSAPVEDPTGMILRLHTIVRLPVVSQDRVTHYFLKSGGAAVGLYATLEARDGSALSSTVSIPPDGSWTYRTLSDTSMELNLFPIGRRVLVFTGDSRGVIEEPVGIVTTFDFLPYEEGSP